MKKGFTLIELLAVLVILGIILVIAVPNILKIINQSKIDTYNNQMKLFQNAASKYIVQYANEISDINNATVSLDKLKEKKLIEDDIRNPITNQPYENMSITIKKLNGVTTYGVSELPDLVTGMIPVYYDEVAGVWKKANATNANNSWYDYSSWKWANAVTVTSTNRATYMGAAVNTTIPMSNINTMWVWIPRYKYRIPSGVDPREIDIVFESKYTPKSIGNAANTYYTHPAFTFGDKELNGIWVGKFETTGTISDLTIMPDLQSIINKPIKVIHDSIKDTMQNQTAKYGFTNDNDIHMTKNIEWGAAAYLTNSRYGKYGNPSYTGINKEVYKNNSSSHYTGRSMGAPGGSGIKITENEYVIAGYYSYDGKCTKIDINLPDPCDEGEVGQIIVNKTLAYGASTSGTIYGIYDMSGGTWDYVMGLYKPEPLPLGIVDESGFSSTMTNSQYDLLTINTKYYDRYLTNLVTTGAILGDATKETSGWFGDFVNFADASAPWFVRGGHYTNTLNAGIMSYGYDDGNCGYSFRITLSPTL